MKEEWKDIVGYEGYYLVSNTGMVKSLERKILREKRRNAYVKERILKAMSDPKGYQIVRLYHKEKAISIRIHKIVATAFMNYKPEPNMVIDHIDNNKSNNCITNLQIISNRKNASKDRKNKTSIYAGVSIYKPTGKWRSSISINKKQINLGHFNTEIEAHKIYTQAVLNIDLFNGCPKSFKRYLNQVYR